METFRESVTEAWITWEMMHPDAEAPTHDAFLAGARFALNAAADIAVDTVRGPGAYDRIGWEIELLIRALSPKPE